MRPVNPHFIANRAPEEFIKRDVKRLGFDVPESDFNAGDGFLGDAAGIMLKTVAHLAVKPLHRPRVLADEARLQVLDTAADAECGTVVGAFTVADQPFVRFHLDEDKSPPAPIAENGCYLGYLHASILQNVKIISFN